jgi:toxin-antitoxin system PIN domain toxin
VSYALDANLLLYASDASSSFHDRALGVLERCAEGPELLYLPWPVVMAYLRIATHPAIFERPLSPEEATSNIDVLLGQPHVRPLGEMDGFWEMYRRTTGGLVVRGNLVPDAHLVALLLQHGVTTLWTHDRDFRKFEGIRVRDPFAESGGPSS